MISIMRKEACSGNIHDLALIPTQNCLADCLTKASAKADNLITAVKTGKLLEVDIHPNFRTLMEHKAFLSFWCRTFMHTNEKYVLFWNALKVSLVQNPPEKTFHVMFVRKQDSQEPKQPMVCDWNHLPLSVALTAELTLKQGHHWESQKKTFEYDDQTATKITSALADTSIRYFRPLTSTLVETLCACLFLVTIFSHSMLLPFLSQCCNHVVIKLGWYLKRKMDK